MSDKTMEQIDIEIEKLQTARDKIVRLNAEMAKPKPRCGDFGYPMASPSTIVLLDGGRNPVGSNGLQHLSVDIVDDSNPYVWMGNMYDLGLAAGDGGVIIAFTKDEAEYHINDSTYEECDSVDTKLQDALERRRKA